ncbi:MAG: 2TM domain-containing protein [Alkalispirochaetaceae bacterium]
MRDEEDLPPELPRSSDRAVASYQKHVEENVARQKASFRAHLGSFLGVNAMLTVIWALTGAGFPWFLIPLFGWGIGLSSHYAALKSAEEEYRNLGILGKVRRNVAKVYRKLAKNRRTWTGHLVSTVATSALLLVINGITWAGFPWALIPIAGMGIGLFSHYPTFQRKETRYLRQLAEEGVDVTRLERGMTYLARRLALPTFEKRGPGAPVQAKAESPEIAEAESLRESILRQLGETEQPALGEDFASALDGFVRQVKELSGTRAEIERIISEIPQEALARDMEELRRKRAGSDSERMRAEYDRSIEELERQERSYRSLKEDAEMITLRSNSAMNALRQINIDLLRMRSRGGEADTAELLRERSEELSRYIDDLHAAYEELD